MATSGEGFPTFSAIKSQQNAPISDGSEQAFSKFCIEVREPFSG